LELPFTGRDEIREQIKSSLVRTLDDDGCLEFQVQSKVHANVKFRVPVEGEGTDADGIKIHILLHVVSGKVNELEIYKEDSSPIRKLIEASGLKIATLEGDVPA
jgi:hypothetical protein